MGVISLLGAMGAAAVSWNPISRLFFSEIFPNKYRAKGVAILTLFGWISNSIVGYLTPIMLDSIGFATFYVYGTVCILCVAFSFWIVETSQVSLEHMIRLWEKKLQAKFNIGY